MKRWDQMPWFLCFECWDLSQFFPLSFTLIKRLFSSSSLSAIRVISSAYLYILICTESSLFICQWAFRLFPYLETILLIVNSAAVNTGVHVSFWIIIVSGCVGHLLLFSCSVVSESLRPRGLQHARPPRPSPSPRACSNSCPLSWWCHPAIFSSVIPLSSGLQSFPASGSFPMSWLAFWIISRGNR